MAPKLCVFYRFEYVYDPAKEAMIYINIDTMQVSTNNLFHKQGDMSYRSNYIKITYDRFTPRRLVYVRSVMLYMSK